jgi:hypothetical protein
MKSLRIADFKAETWTRNFQYTSATDSTATFITICLSVYLSIFFLSSNGFINNNNNNNNNNDNNNDNSQ